jgi:Mce-associated membrane protein
VRAPRFAGERLARARAALGSSRRVRRTAWSTAWVVAAVLCALSAWSYADTRGDAALGYAKARDTVLAAGQQDITRLNTVDAAHLDRDLGQWLDATTGPLHDQLSRTHAADTAALKASGTSTRGTVTDAAVTELDTRAGTAKLIATVQVQVVPKSDAGAATTDRKRFEAGLSRTADGWKLTALTAVPVGAS